MIEKENGYIHFDLLTIKPFMQFNEVITLLKQEEIISCDRSNYINLFLKPQIALGRFFLVRMFFNGKDEKLEMCHISVLENDKIPTWDNWNEGKRKVFLR